MTYVIETSQFTITQHGTAFPTRDAAIAQVREILGGMNGGWSTCPPSHRGKCRWRQVPQEEWAQLGFDSKATDRWMHMTRDTDRWHRERIWVRQTMSLAERGLSPHALGPKPWTVDVENSDPPHSIRIVSAAEQVVLTLTLPQRCPSDDQERAEEIWQAGLRVASEITGGRIDTPPVRLRDGTHAGRYFEAAQVLHDPEADPLAVACQQCGEVKGTPCS